MAGPVRLATAPGLDDSIGCHSFVRAACLPDFQSTWAGRPNTLRRFSVVVATWCVSYAGRRPSPPSSTGLLWRKGRRRRRRHTRAPLSTTPAGIFWHRQFPLTDSGFKSHPPTHTPTQGRTSVNPGRPASPARLVACWGSSRPESRSRGCGVRTQEGRQAAT